VNEKNDELKRVTITKWMNRSRFIQVEDALEIGKVRLFLGGYRKGEGMDEHAQHYLDLEDARVIFSDLADGLALVYKEYKGSVNGTVTSRILSVKRDKDAYWFEVTNGPGKASPTGAVMPDGKPSAQVAIGLPVYDARRLGHAVMAYLRAWEARNLLRVKAAESGMDATRLKVVTKPVDMGFVMAAKAG